MEVLLSCSTRLDCEDHRVRIRRRSLTSVQSHDDRARQNR